jgi:hypothetical protein
MYTSIRSISDAAVIIIKHNTGYRKVEFFLQERPRTSFILTASFTVFLVVFLSATSVEVVVVGELSQAAGIAPISERTLSMKHK